MRKLLAFLFVLLSVSLIHVSCSAQSVRLQTLFARHCVNETGFLITDDSPAMAEALRTRAGGEITTSIIILYSRRTVIRRHEIRDSRRYISFLNRFGTRPRYWRRDSNVHWSQRRDSWMRIYERAGMILRGEIRSRCEAPPEHWSVGRRLARRAKRNGYYRVDCGDTLQDFWRRM